MKKAFFLLLLALMKNEAGNDPKAPEPQSDGQKQQIDPKESFSPIVNPPKTNLIEEELIKEQKGPLNESQTVEIEDVENDDPFTSKKFPIDVLHYLMPDESRKSFREMISGEYEKFKNKEFVFYFNPYNILKDLRICYSKHIFSELFKKTGIPEKFLKYFTFNENNLKDMFKLNDRAYLSFEDLSYGFLKFKNQEEILNSLSGLRSYYQEHNSNPNNENFMRCFLNFISDEKISITHKDGIIGFDLMNIVKFDNIRHTLELLMKVVKKKWFENQSEIIKMLINSFDSRWTKREKYLKSNTKKESLSIEDAVKYLSEKLGININQKKIENMSLENLVKFYQSSKEKILSMEIDDGTNYCEEIYFNVNKIRDIIVSKMNEEVSKILNEKNFINSLFPKKNNIKDDNLDLLTTMGQGGTIYTVPKTHFCNNSKNETSVSYSLGLKELLSLEPNSVPPELKKYLYNKSENDNKTKINFVFKNINFLLERFFEKYRENLNDVFSNPEERVKNFFSHIQHDFSKNNSTFIDFKISIFLRNIVFRHAILMPYFMKMFFMHAKNYFDHKKDSDLSFQEFLSKGDYAVNYDTLQQKDFFMTALEIITDYIENGNYDIRRILISNYIQDLGFFSNPSCEEKMMENSAQNQGSLK